MAFSYPLQIHPGRLCLFSIYNSLNSKHDEVTTSTSPSQSNGRFHYIVTVSSCLNHLNHHLQTIFLLLSYLLSITVKDLGFILSLVGATGSTMVSFILPGFIYYFTFRSSFLSSSISSSSYGVWKLYGSFLLGTLGVILMPLCVTLILIAY